MFKQNISHLIFTWMQTANKRTIKTFKRKMYRRKILSPPKQNMFTIHRSDHKEKEKAVLPVTSSAKQTTQKKHQLKRKNQNKIRLLTDRTEIIIFSVTLFTQPMIPHILTFHKVPHRVNFLIPQHLTCIFLLPSTETFVVCHHIKPDSLAQPNLHHGFIYTAF